MQEGLNFRPIFMFTIANILTGLNLLCGSLAIVLVIQGESKSALLLFLASLIFDFADGWIARMLKQESALGIQLDSLADVVSFGVLPSTMIYSLMNRNESFSYLSYLSFILGVMAAFRLARFNIETDGSARNFQGLPVPAVALVIAGIYTSFHFDSLQNDFIFNSYFLILLIVLCSYLMISRIPILKLVVGKKLIKEHAILLLLYIICFVFILLGKTIFISLLIIVHIFYSIFKLSFFNKK